MGLGDVQPLKTFLFTGGDFFWINMLNFRINMQNKDKIIRRSVLITAAAMVCLFVTHRRCSGKNCPGKSPEELPIEAPTYEIAEPAVTFETTSDCVTKTDREKWEK